MTESIAKPATLAGRIAKISAEIGSIAKTGRNVEQGYQFIEYGEVAAQIRMLHDKYGVAILPQITSYTSNEVRTAKGRIGYHFVLNMKFRVVNTDDQNDVFESSWLGEATDFGDKGINKASTAGEKYFLMKLYHISEKGDDPDETTPDQRPAQRNKATRNNPPQQQAASQPILSKTDEVQCVKVRSQLPLKKTVDELNAYWKELDLNQACKLALKPFFAKRKEEINGAQ